MTYEIVQHPTKKKENTKEWLDEYISLAVHETEDEDVEGIAYDIAESLSPVYYCDIWELASNMFDDIVLREIDLSLAQERPNPLSALSVAIFDYIVETAAELLSAKGTAETEENDK